MIVLLSLLLVVSAVNIIFLISLYRVVHHSIEAGRDYLNDWITPQGEGKPSAFTELIDGIGATLANRMATSVMAAIRGAIGGLASGESKRAEAEMLEGTPGLGVIEALSPGMLKKLGKNPAQLMILQGVLNRIGGGSKGNNSGDSASSTKRRGFEYGK